MAKKTKKPEWGWDFGMVICNPKDTTKLPATEDMDYVWDKFIEAVEQKGLSCGGGTHQTRLDIILCEHCSKNEALDDCDLCAECLDKIAKRHGYTKEK